MKGAERLQPGDAVRNVVMLPDRTILNRYWDERDAPCDEFYLEDVQTAALVKDRLAKEVYRDLRAAAWRARLRLFSSATASRKPYPKHSRMHGAAAMCPPCARFARASAHSSGSMCCIGKILRRCCQNSWPIPRLCRLRL